MKIIVRLLLIFVLLLVVNGCNPSTATNPKDTVTGTEIGNLAPDFQLMNMEGQNVTLSDLRGNPVIINFWASWCGPCREEMPFLQQIYEKWNKEGVLLQTINLRENPPQIAQYMQSNGLTFPVLLDTDGSVTQDYNVIGIPTTFFIDKDGVIQAKRLGPFSSTNEIETNISIIQS
jgi:thiol-disulfide isomerase/thioredoxin